MSLFWIIFAIYVVLPAPYIAEEPWILSQSRLVLLQLCSSLHRLTPLCCCTSHTRSFQTWRSLFVWWHLALLQQHSSLTAVTTEALLHFPSFSVCQQRKAALELCYSCDNLQGVLTRVFNPPPEPVGEGHTALGWLLWVWWCLSLFLLLRVTQRFHSSALGVFSCS